jgi:hypothetical protein
MCSSVSYLANFLGRERCRKEERNLSILERRKREQEKERTLSIISHTVGRIML